MSSTEYEQLLPRILAKRVSASTEALEEKT